MNPYDKEISEAVDALIKYLENRGYDVEVLVNGDILLVDRCKIGDLIARVVNKEAFEDVALQRLRGVGEYPKAVLTKVDFVFW